MNIGPYFNTYLSTTVILHPSQMDNDIYKHLKNNLINDLQNKCYINFCYIEKIYKIEERSGGKIIPEDPSASASYDVKFSCKICRPLKDTTIVCEVVGISKTIIYLRNGPIYMLIFEGQINMDNFVYDEKRNVWLAYGASSYIPGQGIPIVEGSYVKAKITDTQIENKSTRILTLGTLENIATTKESNEIIESREHDSDEFIEYDDYINNNNNKTDIVDEINTPTDLDLSEDNIDGNNDLN